FFALRRVNPRVALPSTYPPNRPPSPTRATLHAKAGLPTEARSPCLRAKVGGEGRTRTFEATRATDLQSAAFDRFATSPTVCVLECVAFGAYHAATRAVRWSWRRDSNPRPADYKSAALPD